MIDLEKIKTIYKVGKNLSLSDVYVLLSAASRKSFSPMEYLIEEGSVRKDLFFIQKGLVRIFAINDKGEEITLSLRWENQPFASPDVILFNRASRFYFQALEPTEVFFMDFDTMDRIVAKHPKLEENRKFILQKMLKDAQERVESFVLHSPEQRYLNYIQDNPDIVNRVPDKYIANVLGITPVSLSRIRKRIALKKKSE